MASRRIKLITTVTALVLGAGGYFLYSVFAVQGQGTLAQAPLNVQTQTPPAFIMGVDDSGSMTFEGLYVADEQAYWGSGCLTGNCANGFFSSAGVMQTSGRGSYYHLIQNGIRLDQNGNTLDTGTNGMRLGIPPLDVFGFARSPAYNKQWFDPTVTYSPWKFADGDPWPDATITAARSDPRANGAAGTRGPNPIVTYDFTQDVRTQNKTANYFAFRLQPGMRLPSGTEYYVRSDRHPNGCGGLGSVAATRNTWRTLSSDYTVTASNNLAYNPGGGNHRGGGCEIHINHFPAVVFLPPGSPPPAGFDTTKAVTVADAAGAGLSLVKYELRSSNFLVPGGVEYIAAIENFANWYTYYGNRNRAMISAMTESLLEPNNMSIGYFSINRRAGNNPGMAGGNLLMRDVNGGDRPALYDDLYTLRADGGTPTRSATVYMGDQFRRSDDDAPVQYACQINAGMLFTDGYTNEGGTFGNAYRDFGNTDSALPRPLGGNPNGNTIADIAYSFYANNLRADLPPGLVPPRENCDDLPLDLRLDCQTNLHMNFYGITLGARGEIYVDDDSTEEAYTTFPNWSVTGTQNLSPKNVDDIWHATLNTRGEFVNAQTPADITAAMRRIIEAVSGGRSPAGSIGVTGSRIGTGSLTVSPFYEARNQGTDWYSTLTARTVTTNPLTGEVSFAQEWEASERLPTNTTDAMARNDIWFGRGLLAPLRFDADNVDFETLCDNPRPGMSQCTAAEIEALGGTDAGGNPTPLTLDQAITYLKGDRNLETERSTDGKLRFRTTPLGDIVNSTPLISAPRDDYGYRSLPAPYGSGYSDYLTEKTAGRRPMVYAGANDGMLHAFDGRLRAEGGGIERFAFIPQSVLGYVGNLLFPYDAADRNDQRFQHRYYVDGPLTVSDAYYGNDWRTVLVGTTGAGARGVFALDVSDASGSSGSFGASDRLWEISDLNTSLLLDVRENIGHVLGRPVIVPIKTGPAAGDIKWRAVFGNGYNSVSNKAVLFVVDIDTGSPNITMIEAEESDAPAGDNGLGNIVVVDRYSGADLTVRGRDGFADTVYAADQKGAVWKFDLRDADPADVDTPLFTTQRYTGGAEDGTRQPILGGLTAAAGPGGGVLVYFGTGSFSFNSDPADTTLQSLYAVLDNGSGITITPDDLLRQSIISTETEDGRTFRTTSQNTGMAGRFGWFIDLPEGERFVGYPRIESGIVFMPTYDPNAAAGCGSTGNNWLYGLNALTGAAGLSNVRFDSPTGSSPGAGAGAVALNTTGTAPVKDVAVLTSPRIDPLAPGAPSDDLDDALAARCSMLVQVAGAPPLYLPRACGRQSWRQIQ